MTFCVVAAFDLKDNTYYMLVAQNLGMFLLPTYIAMRLVRTDALTRLGMRHTPQPLSIMWTTVLIPMSLPFISLSAGLNAAIPLPDWIIQMEKETEQFTQQLLQTDTWQGLWRNILFIAAIPAFVEEAFFRGFLQNLLHRQLRNVHWAIFLTAVTFSAFHLKFLSFMPRLFLGILLGYLFHWSRSLWLPVMAHFVNNLMAVCLYFIVAYNHIDIDMEVVDNTLRAKTVLAVSSTIVVLLLLFIIYYFENRKKVDAAIETAIKKSLP
jgi:membrane protease YdiL (CAAX protease family)